MPTRTVNVVFIQERDEPFNNTPISVFDTLYNVEDGYILHGATHESVWKVAEYLTQWDNGELDEREDTETGNYEDTWQCRINGTLYTLYAHRDLGYVGLNAEIG